LRGRVIMTELKNRIMKAEDYCGKGGHINYNPCKWKYGLSCDG